MQNTNDIAITQPATVKLNATTEVKGNELKGNDFVDLEANKAGQMPKKRLGKKSASSDRYAIAIDNAKLTRKQWWMTVIFGLALMGFAMGNFIVTQRVDALYVFYPFTYFFSGAAAAIILYTVIVPYMPNDLRIGFRKINEENLH